MKRIRFNKIVVVLGLLAGPCAGFAQRADLTLWYRQPAVKWTDALPIGNGFLGAMIYGGAQTEHIQFNEATLWTDGPRSYQRPDAGKYLDSIRNLLFTGRQAEAEALAEAHFMGAKNHDETQYAALKQQWFDKVRADTAAAELAVSVIPAVLAASATPAAPGAFPADDRAWAQMTLPTPNGWETAGMEGVDGAVWFRKTFVLPKGWAEKNLLLDLGKIRDADFTYLNGKLVGHAEGIGTKRRYIVDASVLREGVNVLSVQVINYFDKGGFVGVKNKQPTLFIAPVGNEESRLSLKGVWKYWIQDENPPAFPRYEASYQPFGDVWLRFGVAGLGSAGAAQAPPSDYRRQLDLSNAIAQTTFTASGVKYTREYFSSLPAKAVVMHLDANRPGSISLSASFATPHRLHEIRQVDGSTIALSVRVKDGVMKGVSYLHASVRNGTIRVMGDSLVIDKADEVTFYLVAATNFVNYTDVSGNPEARCRSALKGLEGKTYAQLREAHIRDYQSCFGKFSIDLGRGKNQELPTDERIRAFSNTADPGFVALYVQYARYLLISSSRPGGQPANLQGIWNDELTPSWGSKYTTNINLEMNYWPSEALNLSPCAQPLFALTDQVAEAGRATAKDYYGAPGWVLHHNTDLWRGTAPIDASTNGIWVTGGAWLCHQLWEHFLFTADTAFLREQYPVMKGAADFFVHFLVKDPKTGLLVSTPSNSPEHGGLVAGPTMDHQIIRDLLGNCIDAARVLGVDEDLRRTWADTRSRIAPDRIGRYGQLQEWMEDKDDTTDTHRHVSHLWGVYPGTDITWQDPALMKAARQSLIYRGPDGTGWSIAWKADLWARFRDGNQALEMIDKLLSPADDGVAEKGGVYNNLFDAHPPFQIDGNFGGASGVAEMLIQSQNGYIDLLPALPDAWQQGDVKGICARGAFVLDIRWDARRLQAVTVRSLAGEECILVYGGKKVRFATVKGKVYRLDGSLNVERSEAK